MCFLCSLSGCNIIRSFTKINKEINITRNEFVSTVEDEQTFKREKNENFSTMNENEVIGEAEQFGSFPGGDLAFLRFFDQNVNKSIVGDSTLEPKRALFRFTIDTLGRIGNVKTAVSYNQSVDNECIRVLSIMPNWSPSYFFRNNQWIVDSISYTMPIKIPWRSPNF